MTASTPSLALQTRESLRAARIAAGLSQTRLAAALGVGETTVQRIERGKIAPTLAMVERWAGACGVGVRIVLEAS